MLFTLRPQDKSSIVRECKICVNLAFRSFPLDGLENRIRFLGNDGCLYSIGQKECSFVLPSVNNFFQPCVMYLLNKEDPTTPSFLISPTEYISSNNLKYELDTITGGGFILHPTLGNIVVFNILPISIWSQDHQVENLFSNTKDSNTFVHWRLDHRVYMYSLRYPTIWPYRKNTIFFLLKKTSPEGAENDLKILTERGLV